MRRLTVTAGLLLGALLLAACSRDGRTLAEPRPDQVTTTTAAPPSIDGVDLPATFSLSIPEVDDGGELPLRYTCYGQRLSVPLTWANVPEGAAQLAVVIRDRDAGGFVHWLVTGIDPLTPSLDESRVPEGSVEQVNSTGAIGWYAPCPPEGDDRHVYDLVLHVLHRSIDIDPGLPADEAAALVEEASAEEAPFAVTVTPPATGAGSAP